MLIETYRNIRQYTEKLCEPLEIEDYVPQPVEYVSPPKWHIAHVSWFFENMILSPFLENYTPFHPQYNFLFNSYYQTLGERAVRSQRGFMSRPTVEQIFDYRHYVDRHMHQLLENGVDNKIENLIILGLNHEQQHQELLLTDLKLTFALNPLYPVYHPDFNLVADHNTEDGWLTVESGLYTIGHDDSSFCYDNELGRHNVYLNQYTIAKDLITNGEYLAFMNDAGYETFTHWHDEGWSWINKLGIKSPLYWHNIDGQWFYYTLAGLKPLDENAILSHISYYEAYAFARWKGMRLPTEFEWEVASDGFSWGKRWEITSSAYVEYPGFAISDDAAGEYNGKFMVNQMVFRGASTATAADHSRKTYRNFFHPYYQWQYSGIRLVKNDAE